MQGLMAIWLCASMPTTAQAQIYRCGNTYTNEPCAGGKAVQLEPLTTIPAQRPSPYAAERHEAYEREQTERELDRAEAKVPPVRDKATNKAACEASKRRVKKIDELARKGGSAKKMEQLRQERQDARDWQFSAGC